MAMIGDQKFTNNQMNIIKGLIRLEFKELLESHYASKTVDAEVIEPEKTDAPPADELLVEEVKVQELARASAVIEPEATD